MSHEILERDNVVLHKNRAWHGLGVIVEDAPTPREALTIIGAERAVEQIPLIARYPKDHPVAELRGKEIPVPSHALNVHADDGSPIAVVGSGYEIVQNVAVADFCASLAELDDVVKCETAGTIRNGAKIWFLLKGESFSVRDKDMITPYILVSNAHDGTSSFRVDPTTVRAVCSNTLHMIIGFDGEKAHRGTLTLRHTRSIHERLQQAKAALGLYGRSLTRTQELCNTLARQDVSKDELNAFFMERYQADFGAIPSNPQDEREEAIRTKALGAKASFTKRFDDELDVAGATRWNAFNAYSGLIQHDRKTRGKDDTARVENRVYSNLFGLNEARTNAAFAHALTLAS